MKHNFFLSIFLLYSCFSFGQATHFKEALVSSYPKDGQFNYYLNEYKSGGYFLLSENDKFLARPSSFGLKVVFKDPAGKTVESKATYNAEKFMVEFKVPHTKLEKGQLYELTFFFNKTPWHSIYFRTSLYTSFFEKIKQLEMQLDTTTWVAEGNLDEPFDMTEMAAFNSNKEDAIIRLSFGSLWEHSVRPIHTTNFVNYFKYPNTENYDAAHIVDSLIEMSRPKEEVAEEVVVDERLRKLNKRYAGRGYRRDEPLDERYKNEVVVHNGHSIHPIPSQEGKIILEQKAKGKLGTITKKNFDKNKIPKFSAAKITLRVPFYTELTEVVNKTRAIIPIREKQLKEYEEELMAEFGKRTDVPESLTKERFAKMISTPLSIDAKKIVEIDFRVLLMQVYVSRRMSDFERWTSQIKFQFKY